MGEVYLAENVELDRQVALKVLHADVANDEDRVRRFVQERKPHRLLTTQTFSPSTKLERRRTCDLLQTEPGEAL